MIDYSSKLASRCIDMDPSAIRELFKVLAVPGMISFAGGVPALESFPFETIKRLQGLVLEKYGPKILQYGITEGFAPLRETLAPYIAKRGIHVSSEQICISTGAQNAIDAAAKILLGKGDTVAVEAPTFLAALKAFKSYQARFVEVETDEQGVIPESFEELCKNENIKFFYIIPNFQNPSGRTLSGPRRTAIARMAKEHGVLVVEDDPYYELRYQGDNLPALKSLAPENVIYIGSLSKIFSPGMRVGYYIAPQPLAELMTSGRQAVDVHTNNIAQAVAAEYIASSELDRHLPSIIALYKPRLEAMLAALSENLSADFSWSNPDGGMYVWVEGPAGFHAAAAYQQAVERKVAFVPGRSFFVDAQRGNGAFRLNFTAVSESQIREGISILGEVLRLVGTGV